MKRGLKSFFNFFFLKWLMIDTLSGVNKKWFTAKSLVLFQGMTWFKILGQDVSAGFTSTMCTVLLPHHFLLDFQGYRLLRGSCTAELLRC